MDPQPSTPRYDTAGLAGVLPGVLDSLTGHDGAAGLPPARRAVVVLVDGLGLSLLERRRGHAPFLRSLLGRTVELSAGFPTTTATSMGTFGTGLPPGSHGLTGYQVRLPGSPARLLNELSWEDGPDPLRWQPETTVLQRAEQAGIRTTMVAPGYFDGSGLTRAALRPGRFRGAERLDARVDAALAALRADPRALVYLYWGELDRAGHEHGVGSEQWGVELEAVDAQLRRLAGSVPADCSVTVTADHGMVDVPLDARVDVARDPELDDGVELVGGEVRAAHLYCRPGAEPDVLATWSARLGDRAWVLTREHALAAGWFGPVHERVLERIGQVLVAFHAPAGVVDSRVMRPLVMGLLGQHGSLTDDEMRIPLLHLPPAAAG